MEQPIIRKQFEAFREEGWIVVNTPALDRERDRVFPAGAKAENYLKNPVLLWGHNYRDPWAVIGRVAEIEITNEVIRIRPEFRQPTGPTDPMVIIENLWAAGLIRAASIGFLPLEAEQNKEGGRDYLDWEWLETSLVPVPANQEALRLALKGMTVQWEGLVEAVLRPAPDPAEERAIPDPEFEPEEPDPPAAPAQGGEEEPAEEAVGMEDFWEALLALLEAFREEFEES